MLSVKPGMDIRSKQQNTSQRTTCRLTWTAKYLNNCSVVGVHVNLQEGRFQRGLVCFGRMGARQTNSRHIDRQCTIEEKMLPIRMPSVHQAHCLYS